MIDFNIDRRRNFLISGCASYGATIISIVSGLISVPIGLSYFGPVRYGIWLVIASVMAYLWISDFGIGLAALTLIAKTPNPTHQRNVLARSVGLLLKLSILFFIIIIIINYLFPGWTSILGKIPSNFQGEAKTALLAIIFFVILQIPTTIFSAVFSGLQKVYWNRVYGALRSVMALAALIVTVLISGNLVALALFTGLGGLLVGVISGVHLFLTNPNIRPRLGEKIVSAPSTAFLFKSGIRFLILQIVVLIIWNTDNLVISNFLGPEKVIPYAITFKFFQIGLLMVAGLNAALWPMYGQATAKGDWVWIQKTYNNSTILQIIGGGLILIGGVIYSQLIIGLWAGAAAYGGLAVALAIGGYVYISSFGTSNASLINGLNPTNSVVVIGIAEGLLNLAISIILVKPLGIFGVALGTLVAGLVTNTWFGPLYIRNKTQRKINLVWRPIFYHAIVVVLCVVFSIAIVLYFPSGLIRYTTGAFIICLYLLLSWRVIPKDIKDLFKRV